jgi:hypothetical protein
MLFTALTTCPIEGEGLEFHDEPQKSNCRDTSAMMAPPSLLVVVLAGASQGL